MNKIIIILFIALGSLVSCKKEPGEGGFASIEGKVYVYNYDESFTILKSQHYLPAENVFIIYGDGTTVSNDVKTSYDGSYKFSYLRKGKYKIFVVGKDSTKPYKSMPKEILVDVEIKEKKEKKILDDFIIIND